MLAWLASWGAFAGVASSVYAATAAISPLVLSPALLLSSLSTLSTPRRSLLAALLSLYLATFRKRFPCAFHVRGFASIAARAIVALVRGRGLQRPGDARTTRHRVLLGDMDFNGHQNNARCVITQTYARTRSTA